VKLIKIHLRNQQVILDDYSHLDALVSYARVMQTGNIEDRWDIPIERIYLPGKEKFVFDCSVWFGNILKLQDSIYTRNPLRGFNRMFSLDTGTDTAFKNQIILSGGRMKNYMFSLRHIVINEICFLANTDNNGASEISDLLYSLPGIGKKKIGKVKEITTEGIAGSSVPELYRVTPTDIKNSDSFRAQYGYRSPYWHIDNQGECYMPPVPLERAEWLKELNL
jgi:hypothetical protein